MNSESDSYKLGGNSMICRWAGCKKAGKPFRFQLGLRVHIRLHCKEKQFKCNFKVILVPKCCLVIHHCSLIIIKV